MLIRRGSFELGPKSILYLSLVFAFFGKPILSSDARYEEFGCVFADKQFKMMDHDKKQPVYSDVTMDSESLVNNRPIFVEDLEKVFFEANIMNEMSLFTKFVRDYKNNTSNTTLESFFNNYDVPFETNEYYNVQKRTLRKTRDRASYLIQDLLALKGHLKSINQSISPYIVTAFVDPTGVNFSDPIDPARLTEDVEKLLHNRVQHHLAGVIKINSGDRKGYILMDPGYANGRKIQYHPFIAYVMQDQLPPHEDFISGYENNEPIEFSVEGGTENPFILAKHPNLTTMRNVLYYARKPYCSFMENTIKGNLLRPYQEIIERDVKGIAKAYVNIKIEPGKQDFGFHVTNLNKIPRLGKSFATINQEATESLQDAFEISPEDIKIISDQLEFILTSVLGDDNLMSEIVNLTKVLDLNNLNIKHYEYFPKAQIKPRKQGLKNPPREGEPKIGPDGLGGYSPNAVKRLAQKLHLVRRFGQI